MHESDDFVMRRVQTSIATHLLREMDALTFAARFLKTQKPRILSFGCSVGDELATLRLIFPDAEIFGFDIDEHALRTAQDRFGHMATICLSSPKNIVERAPYDLICAFSSICLNPFPGEQKLRQEFPFSYFDDLLSFLDAQLSDDGLLCLRNTSYPFGSTRIAAQYQRLRSNRFLHNGFIPLAHSETGMILSPVKTPFRLVWRIGNAEGISDWDLIDCVYRKLRKTETQREPVVITEVWERPQEFDQVVATWRSTNLDAVVNGDTDNILEVREAFTAYRSAINPHLLVLENATQRTSIETGGMLDLGTQGRMLRGASAPVGESEM